MKKRWVVLLFVLSGLCGLLLSLYVHSNVSSPAINTIETYHYPALFVAQLKNDPAAGEKIFKEFCAACHAVTPSIDIKAPRLGDKKVWRGLRQLGEDKLLAITINGVGAMPARGGCFECSDQQLLETIRYILRYQQGAEKK